MKKLICFVALIFVLNILTIAFELSGSIYDSQLMPVEEAEVYVNGVGPFVSSQEGTFSLKTEGRIELIITAEGFTTYIREMIVTEDSTVSVMLRPADEKKRFLP